MRDDVFPAPQDAFSRRANRRNYWSLIPPGDKVYMCSVFGQMFYVPQRTQRFSVLTVLYNENINAPQQPGWSKSQSAFLALEVCCPNIWSTRPSMHLESIFRTAIKKPNTSAGVSELK